jgi:hypothetical protein
VSHPGINAEKRKACPPSDIAKALKIGRAPVYRVLGHRADKEAAP